MIDFTLSKKQQELKEGIHELGKYVIRPMSLEMDRKHEVPEPFLRNFMTHGVELPRLGGPLRRSSERRASRRSRKADSRQAESPRPTAPRPSPPRSWPGPTRRCCSACRAPASAAPPVRATGTPEQKKRFFGMFDDMDTGPLQWGAYGLTEPGAGSDVAGIRTSCRKDGKHWVLNGRKCFITNGGARDLERSSSPPSIPRLGRAGHRAFVVEKGTPGFERRQD